VPLLLCTVYKENRYRLTRKCLEILIDNNWPIIIQTKSPLILRDLHLLKSSSTLDVYITITTGDDGIQRLFEPHGLQMEERINALKRLHQEGIRTHLMMAPLLIGAETLVEKTTSHVYSVLIDRMNYHLQTGCTGRTG